MTPKAQARVLVRAYEGGAFTDLGEPLAKGTLGAVQLFSRSGREMVCSEAPERNALARIEELLGREVTRSDVSSLRKCVRDGSRAEIGRQLLCFGLTRRVNDRARGRR